MVLDEARLHVTKLPHRVLILVNLTQWLISRCCYLVDIAKLEMANASLFYTINCNRFDSCCHVDRFRGRSANQGTPIPPHASYRFPDGKSLPLLFADNPRGVLGGIQYGTNWQFNRLCLLASDFSFSDIKASQTVVTAPGGIATTSSGEQKLDWLSTTRGRIGYLLTDNLLLYGTGGLASGRATANTFIAQAGCPVGSCLAGSELKTLWGWEAGWWTGICNGPLVIAGGISARRSRRFELQCGRPRVLLHWLGRQTKFPATLCAERSATSLTGRSGTLSSAVVHLCDHFPRMIT